MKCLLITAIMSLLALTGCNSGSASGDAKKSSSPKAETKTANEVTVTVAQQRENLFQFETVQLEQWPELLSLPGRIVLADDASWHVGVISTGRVEQVYVNVGDRVTKGQVLARMHSHDVHEARAGYLSAQAELSKAQAALALAQRNRDRTQRLYEMKAASLEETERARQELVNAEAAARDAEIAVEREKVHLQETLGVPADSKGDRQSELIPIRAPGSGFVLGRKISPGTVADASEDAFVVGDIRHLWMQASANENSISQLKVGQAVTVKAHAFPGEEFRGKITNLGQQLDPTTRVMPVRVELQNSALRLRPEMLATAQVAVGRTAPALMISTDAIQQMQEQDVVFVKRDAEHIEARFIHTGETSGGRTRVLEGLRPGETIATKGSFILKSQMLKAEMQGEE